jgi:hypothetical protein
LVLGFSWAGLEAKLASQEAAVAAKQRHSSELLARPEVSGVGTARAGDDDWVVEVHLNVGAGRQDLPAQLDGVAVRIVEDGPFRAGPPKSPDA